MVKSSLTNPNQQSAQFSRHHQTPQQGRYFNKTEDGAFGQSLSGTKSCSTSPEDPASTKKKTHCSSFVSPGTNIAKISDGSTAKCVNSGKLAAPSK